MVESRASTGVIIAFANAVIIRPNTSAENAQVVTHFDVSSRLPAPMHCATATFMPQPRPMSIPVNSVTSIEVEPTLPSAPLPAKRPTTAISDILNNT